MKTATFLEGAILALVSSLIGTVTYTALAPVVDSESAICLTIATLSLGYVVYLLKRSRERIGQFSTIVIWTIVTIAMFWFIPSPLPFLAIQLGLIWLVRSLYFYASVISALADLLLTGFSLMAAVWAVYQTESLFLCTWCCLLVNALFVFIPMDMTRRVADTRPVQLDRFQQAYQAAESALYKRTIT
jgi:hypothetical protein